MSASAFEPPFAESEIEVTEGLVYAAPGGRELKLDLYRPRASGPCPVILWLHGGGWRFGNRRQAPPLRRYFAERGYAMASIDYRRSDEAVFPAAVEDVKFAIRWLKGAAATYGLDPDRIGLWGSSAGGHLAALATTSGPGVFEDAASGEPDSAVAAVIVAYAPSDFLQLDAYRDPEGKPSDDAESIQLPAGKRSRDPDSLESLFLGAPIETVPDTVRAANPITYVRPGLPPFLILHGTADTAVPAHQSLLLHDALITAGASATLGLIDGLGHGFLNRANLDDTPREILWDGPDGRGRRNGRPFTLIGDWFDRYLRDIPCA